MATKQLPAKGEVLEVDVWVYDPSQPPRLVNGQSQYQDHRQGYKWVPYKNIVVTQKMTVTGVVYWGDNSIDVEGILEDGTSHKVQWMYPHGDSCY
jgi:hypothetical protein